MSVPVGQAMEQALAYHRAPTMLSGAQGRPLPEGMMTLLRLAGGDQAMVAQCVEASGETGQEVVAAAVFFIQQVMFAPGADSYRVLGVDAGAPDARIKEHYRWLVRWLHPDRNTDDWDSVYADRVTTAWQDLRSPDRRRTYDQSLAAGAAVAEDDFGDESIMARPAVFVPRPEPAAPMPAPEPARLSAESARKLPVIVLSALGGAAVTLMLLMWLAADPRDLPGGQGGVAATATAPTPRPLALEERPSTMAEAQPTVADPPEPAVQESTPEPVPVAAVVQPSVPPETPATQASAPPPRVAVAPVPAAPAAPAVAAAPAPAPVAPPPVAPKPTPVAAAAPAAPVRPAQPRPAATAAAPATTAAPPAPPAVASTSQIAEAQGHALLRRFSDAYRAGDINGLMRLFTTDARNNRGGREAIVYDYQSLFSASESRELHLRPTGWMAGDEGATLLAEYEARVQAPGRRREEVSRGSIRFDLRLVNGEPRISLVRHD